VDTAILSHLHEDHIGGLPELAGADLLVAAAEWGQLSGVSPELRGFLTYGAELLLGAGSRRRWTQTAGRDHQEGSSR
jgi:glyoxylase-like metal-dependent hydrolase (beta-lactamase superfamily II)